MSLVFAIEPLAACWNEMVALAAQHWQETESYRHGQPFLPLLARYEPYDKAGWYFEATARDAGRLVGYCGMYLVPSMHSQCLIATEDSLFLHRDSRKGRNAIRFIQFVEDECRRRGVVEVGITSKTEHVRRLLELLDFPVTSWQHTKQLTVSPGGDTAITPVMEDAADVLTRPTSRS